MLLVGLMKTERHITQRTKNISHVVEDDASDVFADQRESNLDVVVKKCIPAERQTCRRRRRSACCKGRSGVARSSLVECECPKGVRATAEEPFAERDRFPRRNAGWGMERSYYSELRLAGQHNRLG